jgi:septum formation inhibitor-activating ATPase MinD
MSTLLCPHCRKEIGLFGKGGGQELAKEMNIQFLGSIPIDTDICALSDNGTPFILEKPDSEASKACKSIVDFITTQLNKQS